MTSTPNTPANRATYLAKGRRFFGGYVIAVLVSALLFRGGIHDPDSAMQTLMMAPASLLCIPSAWIGAAACEFCFTLRGFGTDYLYAEDSFPRWYGSAKAVSACAGLLMVGGLIALVCIL